MIEYRTYVTVARKNEVVGAVMCFALSAISYTTLGSNIEYPTRECTSFKKPQNDALLFFHCNHTYLNAELKSCIITHFFFYGLVAEWQQFKSSAAASHHALLQD